VEVQKAVGNQHNTDYLNGPCQITEALPPTDLIKRHDHHFDTRELCAACAQKGN